MLGRDGRASRWRQTRKFCSASSPEEAPMEVAFGIFDHLERRDVPLDQLYEERLQLLEAAERAGIFCYHLAEHHATPLGMAPSPNIFLTPSRCARADALRAVGVSAAALSSDAAGRGNLHARSTERRTPRSRRRARHFALRAGALRRSFLESREIFEESLKVVVEGLRRRKISHRGERYKFAGAPIEVAPKQQPNPPFWYGASTPDGLAFAARHRMKS